MAETNSSPAPPPLLSPHGRLLLAIHHEPGLTQTQYGQRIGLSRRTIIRLLDDLDTVGYVTTCLTQTILDINIEHEALLPNGAKIGDWLASKPKP